LSAELARFGQVSGEILIETRQCRFNDFFFKLEVALKGRIKVTTSDGQSRIVELGDTVWFEDIHGKGHMEELLDDVDA
jgi:hypothetical protein